MKPIIYSTKDVNPIFLKTFMQSRGLNNAQLAKILDVERASVGAWINGTREISEKYKEKLFNLSQLSLSDDLIITPLSNDLCNFIQTLSNLSDLHYIVNAYIKILNSISYKYIDLIPHHADEREMGVFENFLKAHDDISLSRFNFLLSKVLNNRIYINHLQPFDFAQKCIDLYLKEKLQENNFENILFELDKEDLFVHFSQSFDINCKLYERMEQIDSKFAKWDYISNSYETVFNTETGECYLDGDELNKALEPIKQEHIEFVHENSEFLFNYTSFLIDDENSQWISLNEYSVSYKIFLDDPKFKESLRVLMARLGIDEFN